VAMACGCKCSWLHTECYDLMLAIDKEWDHGWGGRPGRATVCPVCRGSAEVRLRRVVPKEDEDAPPPKKARHE
jgi:hypothetical protein